MSFAIGEVVGAYKIVSLIGIGGAGQVFKVEHTITRRIEALKVLSGPANAGEQAQRFLREIQIQASLSHPHIASVHNAFRVGDDLVMVMEFVEGESLKQILERSRMPLETALDYAGQALSALEYAHAHHVTHRDITPGNMIVTASGTVKLTDFGLAKSPADTRVTQSGAVLGSLFYMSPEQVRAEPDLDQRSDVYSMGAVLYEMVTGARPFTGDSAFAIMSAHVGQAPKSPLAVEPSLPPALSEIILQALAKNKDQRFQSAADFHAALESVELSAVKITKPRVALRWSLGTVALLIGAVFLPNLSNRRAPRESQAAPDSALPLVAAEPKRESPAPKPSRITAGSAVWALALSPSGKWLAAGTEDRNIEIWNTHTGERHATLRGHSAGVTAVSFSRDERSLVSGSADRTSRLWDLRRNVERKSFRVSAFVTAVALSGDGGWLAVGSSDKKVKLLNLKAEGQTSGFREKSEPSALAFSPDGALVAVAGVDGLRLKRVNNGREVQFFRRRGAGALALRSDGHWLALSAAAPGLKVWDLSESRELAAVPLRGSTRALALSCNGSIVASASDDLAITIREITPIVSPVAGLRAGSSIR